MGLKIKYSISSIRVYLLIAAFVFLFDSGAYAGPEKDGKNFTAFQRGNGVCETEENINNCPADCKKVMISGNTFGGSAAANDEGYADVNDLGVEVRGILQWNQINPQKIRVIDRIVSKVKYPITISLVAMKKPVTSDLPGNYNGRYVLPQCDDLTAWQNVVKKLVLRYSGTDGNYGCKIGNGKDCYKDSDGLYPDEATRRAIKERPIKNWQIENEWLNQVVDPNDPKQHGNDQDMANYFITMRNMIKQIDPDAKIILGAIAATDLSAAVDGYSSSGKIGFGDPDFRYEEHNAGEEFLFKSILVSDAQREKYFIVRLASYYDVIDYHSYSNSPYEINYSLRWLRKIIADNNITGKEIWSTENAGPFNYFVVMGKPRPACPDPKAFKEGGISLREFTKTYFDPEIQSSHLVQRHVISAANGAGKIFSGIPIWPFEGWSDNYVRNSLLDENGKKPAYYTYKLMTVKLKDAISVEKIDDYVYQFSFSDKRPVFVAWSDAGEKTIDLSSYISTANAKVTHIITEREKTDADAGVEVCSGKSIKINRAPEFIEDMK